MLKKRILASSMASVMALSSVSVVAFAAETTEDVAKKNGESVTSNELQKYVDSLTTFMEGEIDLYGSKQGEQMKAAYDHANVILNNVRSTDAEITGAYQMLKAVYNARHIYTKEELATLIKGYQSTYDRNNIKNQDDDINDYIYDDTSFSEFVTAFDNATFYVDSDDSRSITDAYVNLKYEYDTLKPLDIVTKAEFRTAIKQYQDLELEMKKYEAWRRGTISSAPGTGSKSGEKDRDDIKKLGKVLVDEKVVISFEQLKNMVYFASDDIFKIWDEDLEDWVYLNDGYGDFIEKDSTSNARWIGKNDVYNGYTPGTDEDGTTRPRILYDAVTAQYDRLTNAKNVYETTEPNIVNAWKAAKEAVKVFKSWKPDSYVSGSKATAANLVNKKYHNRLVEYFNEKAILEFIGGTELPVGDEVDKSVSIGTLTAKFTYDPEAHTMKTDKEFYVVKNKDTGFMVVAANSTYNASMYKDFASADTAAKALNTTNNTDKYIAQKVASKTDVLQWINYDVEVDAYKTVNAIEDAKKDAVAAFKAAYNATGVKDKLINDPLDNKTTTNDSIEPTASSSDAGHIAAFDLNADLANAVKSTNQSATFDGSTKATYKTLKPKAGGSDPAIAADAINAHNAAVDAIKKASDKYDATIALLTKIDAITNVYNTVKETPAASDPTIVAKNSKEIVNAIVNFVDTYNTLKTGKPTASPTAKLSVKVDGTNHDIETDVNAGWTNHSASTTDQFKILADYAKLVNETGVTADSTIQKVAATAGTTLNADAVKHNTAYDELKTAYEGIGIAVKNYQEDKEAHTELEALLNDYEFYRDIKDFKKLGTNEAGVKRIIEYLTRGGKTIPNAAGSTQEWTLMWRYLAYKLDDYFHEEKASTYTLNQLLTLTNRAQDIIDKTGDASLFNDPHMMVVDFRGIALDWYARARATTGWKSDMDITCQNYAYTAKIKAVYEGLEARVEILEDWYEGFKYSYGDIRADIAKIADAFDKNEVSDAKLLASLEEVALLLNNLETSDVKEADDYETNAVFDAERVFQTNNRLKTAKGKSYEDPNSYEKELKEKYEALVDAYNAIVNPEKPAVPGDTDDDGAITMADLNVILQDVLDGKTDNLKLDADGSGAVDFDDVNFALDIVLKAMG